MQEVKLFVRFFGIPNPGMGVVSPEEAEDELEYKWLSQGFKVFSTHYMGEVNPSGEVIGYKLLLVLVRDTEVAPIQEVPQKPKTLKDLGK